MHAALTSRRGDRKEYSHVIGRSSSALVVTAEPIPSFPLPFAVLECVWMCVMYARWPPSGIKVSKMGKIRKKCFTLLRLWSSSVITKPCRITTRWKGIEKRKIYLFCMSNKILNLLFDKHFKINKK